MQLRRLAFVFSHPRGWRGSLQYHEHLALQLRYVHSHFLQRIQMGVSLQQVADDVRMVMVQKNKANCKAPATFKFP